MARQPALASFSSSTWTDPLLMMILRPSLHRFAPSTPAWPSARKVGSACLSLMHRRHLSALPGQHPPERSPISWVTAACTAAPALPAPEFHSHLPRSQAPHGALALQGLPTAPQQQRQCRRSAAFSSRASRLTSSLRWPWRSPIQLAARSHSCAPSSGWVLGLWVPGMLAALVPIKLV